jgi:threonine synthase
MHALQRLRIDGASGDWAVVSTAHPAKFERVVEPLIGRQVPIPAPLAALLARSSRADPLPASDQALAAVLRG